MCDGLQSGAAKPCVPRVSVASTEASAPARRHPPCCCPPPSWTRPASCSGASTPAKFPSESRPRHLANAPVDAAGALVERVLGNGGGGPPRRALRSAAIVSFPLLRAMSKSKVVGRKREEGEGEVKQEDTRTKIWVFQAQPTPDALQRVVGELLHVPSLAAPQALGRLQEMFVKDRPQQSIPTELPAGAKRPVFGGRRPLLRAVGCLMIIVVHPLVDRTRSTCRGGSRRC